MDWRPTVVKPFCNWVACVLLNPALELITLHGLWSVSSECVRMAENGQLLQYYSPTRDWPTHDLPPSPHTHYIWSVDTGQLASSEPEAAGAVTHWMTKRTQWPLAAPTHWLTKASWFTHTHTHTEWPLGHLHLGRLTGHSYMHSIPGRTGARGMVWNGKLGTVTLYSSIFTMIR